MWLAQQSLNTSLTSLTRLTDLWSIQWSVINQKQPTESKDIFLCVIVCYSLSVKGAVYVTQSI